MAKDSKAFSKSEMRGLIQRSRLYRSALQRRRVTTAINQRTAKSLRVPFVTAWTQPDKSHFCPLMVTSWVTINGIGMQG
jgi:hypothetical protein